MAGGVEQERASTLGSPKGRAMKPLTILWQRLVKEGQTCDRCGGTHVELQKAVDRLQGALAPLGFEPRLETQEIDEPAFHDAPLGVEPHLDRWRPDGGLARCPRGRKPLLRRLRRLRLPDGQRG